MSLVLVRLSVPVLVIDWKDSSPKCKPYSLIHSRLSCAPTLRRRSGITSTGRCLYACI